MFRYDRKTKALHVFEPVRVLSGRDLYKKYGQRVPVDKTDFVGFSRNPLELMDHAMQNAHISAEEHIRLMNELDSRESRETPRDKSPDDVDSSSDSE